MKVVVFGCLNCYLYLPSRAPIRHGVRVVVLSHKKTGMSRRKDIYRERGRGKRGGRRKGRIMRHERRPDGSG